jgi:hypothetical protein
MCSVDRLHIISHVIADEQQLVLCSQACSNVGVSHVAGKGAKTSQCNMLHQQIPNVNPAQHLQRHCHQVNGDLWTENKVSLVFVG